MTNSKAPALLVGLIVLAMTLPAFARQEAVRTTETSQEAAAATTSTSAEVRSEQGSNPDRVTKTVVKPISFNVEYRFDRTMRTGTVRKVRDGVAGRIETRFEIQLDAQGREVSRRAIETRRIEPQPAVFAMGRAGHQTSRSSFTRRGNVRTMEATAYTPCAGRKNPTFRTRTGLPARFGVVAVDPRVIPLGTLLFVEGYGFAIAADTGGAIKGNKIDVCLPTRSQVMNWGRRKVRVHVFNERYRL